MNQLLKARNYLKLTEEEFALLLGGVSVSTVLLNTDEVFQGHDALSVPLGILFCADPSKCARVLLEHQLEVCTDPDERLRLSALSVKLMGVA